ncbi:hypothetical protein CVT26_009679 [Gymnopilus dilepis]|uniref:Transmembrane protein n=1 Tax=Gymnopilus dilepis TaxID=231916 RepID=A0A409WCN9_9AGAR|nr:hypothetical protein CVT26_009679 [Gymnopilus dilepis]
MNTKIIDDQDPTVNYSGAWGKAGGPNELDGTTTWTHASGATATLHFSGTGISVFGTIPNIGRGTSPSSSYSIDGSTSGSFTGTQRSDVQYKVVFFQSSTLSAGDHTLVVTNVGNATGLLYIDFFQIVENDPSTPSPGTTVTVTSTPPPPPPSPSAHPPTSSLSRTASPQSTSTTTPSKSLVESSPTDGPSLATITVTSSTSSNSSVVASTSSEHVRSTSAIGVVVGGVLGGLFVLGLFAFLFLYFIRRSRKARLPLAQNNGRVQQPLLPSAQLTQVTPFDLAESDIRLSSGGLNTLPSKSSQSGFTHSSSPSWGGQTYASGGYQQSITPSDSASTAGIIGSSSLPLRRDGSSGIPSIYGTIARSEAGIVISHPLSDSGSNAQTHEFYDPPPRYIQMTTRIVDDQDPAVIYSSGWEQLNAASAFDGTKSLSFIHGDTAVLEFSGVGISVYGEVLPSGETSVPVSSYSLDGGAPSFFTAVEGNTTQNGAIFFQSEILSAGNHTLIVTNEGTDGHIYLDYFVVDIHLNTSAPSSSPAIPPTNTTVTVTKSVSTTHSFFISNSPSSSDRTTQFSTSSSTRTPTSTTSSGFWSSTSSSVGSSPWSSAAMTSSSGLPTPWSSPSGGAAQVQTDAIVGAVMGGLFLFAVLGLFYFRRRKHSQRVVLSGFDSNSDTTLPHFRRRLTDVTPFDLNIRSSSPHDPSSDHAQSGSSSPESQYSNLEGGILAQPLHTSSSFDVLKTKMTTRTVDDQDPAVIYSTGWKHLTKFQGDSQLFNRTKSLAMGSGHTAVLEFSGVQIRVYGEIAPANQSPAPISSYSLDGGASVSYTGVQKDTKWQEGVLFFESEILSLGNHTLIVTNEGKDGHLYLDYFLIIIASTFPLPSTSSGNTTITVTLSTTYTPSFSPFSSLADPTQILTSSKTGTWLTTESQNPQSSLSSSGGGKVNVQTDAIVGAVMSGLLLFVILGLCYLWRRKHVILSSLDNNGHGTLTYFRNRLTDVIPFDVNIRRSNPRGPFHQPHSGSTSLEEGYPSAAKGLGGITTLGSTNISPCSRSNVGHSRQDPPPRYDSGVQLE